MINPEGCAATVRTAVTLAAVALVLPLMVAGLAGACPASGTDFYVPPVPLPAGAPGDILRAEPMSVALSVPGPNGPMPASATRIMYRSNDTHGEPVAVTGTYFDPALAWSGPGPRPLVSLAVGTHGQGDHCARPRACSTRSRITRRYSMS
ncbi:hypothetical protein [Nocardia sp. NPDC058480]|uniref:hypothetical protein n=1 Tax=unclassified Nocardia TaxID=2637762 RepID=UPI00365BE22E